jgi:uncharacterized protein YutE (UPF0331/DUF86 family)
LLDAESIRLRLGRLEWLLEQLERNRARGRSAYRADANLRGATERYLQLAEQICIDVGAQLVSELSARPPTDYADIFRSLAAGGHLGRALSDRLIAAAKQRNLLVHLYLEVDDEEVWESLDHLDDLRAFAEFVQRLLDEDEDEDTPGKSDRPD